MKDLQEKDEQVKPETNETAKQASDDNQAQGNKHQQVDEEGNEVTPDDIK
jgi:hypothetical protein